MTIRVRLASIPVLLVLVAGTLAMTSCGSGASEQPAATGGEAAAPVGDTGPSGQQPAELENTISGLATVEEVEVQVVEEGVQIRVQVVARGTLPDGCTTISGSTVNRDGRTFTITINTTRPVDAACTEAVTPFEEIIPLEVGGLPAGIYTLTVNGLSTSFRLSEEAGRAAPTPAATPPPGIPASCVSLAADRVTYVNREGGYCFLYPIELRLEEMAPDRVSFSGAVEAPGIAPVPVRLEVQVGESVGGQPLEALVSTEIGDAEVTRTPATIGGSPAEVVEGLPGNPGARRAYILYNDRLYTVTLSPLGDFPQAGDEAFSAEDVLVWEVAWDTVWQVVVNSFAFLTEGAGELYAACPQPDENTLAYLNAAHGYCLLYPASFEINTGAARTLTLSGPPLDDSPEPLRATLTIILEGPAEGRTAAQVAESYIDEFGGSLPVTRTQTTIGGEPAEVVEGLPGRTGNRQAFVVHNGLVYIFVAEPVDPAFPQAGPDVEAVWQTVTSSLVFIP